MSRQDDLQRLITKHQRALQKLKEQQASFGLHTPPYILIEIEDIETEIAKLQTQLAELKCLEVSPAVSSLAPVPEPTKLPKVITPTQPFEPELILIPADEFLMGSDPKKDKDAREDEQPQLRLYLPDYYIYSQNAGDHCMRY